MAMGLSSKVEKLFLVIFKQVNNAEGRFIPKLRTLYTQTGLLLRIVQKLIYAQLDKTSNIKLKID